LTLLAELTREVTSQGGLIAAAVRPPVAAGSASGPSLGAMAAAGPRAARNRAEYELLFELIYEGYLLHYGSGRVVRPDEPDLSLLAGDQLYALGLVHLARLGDIDAVAEFADAISLCAQAHAGGDPDLAGAVWEAAARAVGWGGSTELDAAKDATRAGRPGAASAFREVARSR
jgi:hypothetical protein